VVLVLDVLLLAALVADIFVFGGLNKPVFDIIVFGAFMAVW
jgi:hypothetical protein